MFNIEKTGDENELTLRMIGKLNSVTSPQFKDEAFAAANTCKKLVLDFAELQYVASAGLRVILELHKTMSAVGKSVSLTNVDAGTMEILEATGLTRFLAIK